MMWKSTTALFYRESLHKLVALLFSVYVVNLLVKGDIQVMRDCGFCSKMLRGWSVCELAATLLLHPYSVAWAKIPWPVSDTDIWQHQVHTSVQNSVQLSVHIPVHKSSPDSSFYDYPLSSS